MKTIKEIFKNNTHLLDEPEVKELITQFERQYKQLQKKKDDYENKVIDLCINSNLIVINGMDCKDVVNKILEL